MKILDKVHVWKEERLLIGQQGRVDESEPRYESN